MSADILGWDRSDLALMLVTVLWIAFITTWGVVQ